MALAQLDTARAAADWLAQRGARALSTDSRRVAPGGAFIAWPGHAHDGREYVRSALAGGASACLVEADGAAAFGFDDARIAALGGLKAKAGPVVSLFLGRPSERLHIVACTGTNGKTSTSWWIAQALSLLGRRCALVGTLGSGEPAAAVPERTSTPVAALALTPTGLTTPDPVTLQSILRGFVDSGIGACALEASSIGIAEERLAGTRIEIAVYTNFTQDHLDYHRDMEAYWQAKAQLFAWPGLKAAVLNIDDVRGATLQTALGGAGLDVWSYSARQDARLRAVGIRHLGSGGGAIAGDCAFGGLAFEVVEGESRAAVSTALVGDYNVSNLLAVIGALRASGIALAAAARACSALTPVPGRMQCIAGSDAEPAVVVDYAHTPDALENALHALQPFATERGGRLWCVFGCGGNRDSRKRPLMGALARRLAQRVVITSDNPRDEAPDFIISQILAGVIGHDEVDVIENRAEAIAHAVREADAHDVILLAGKGHETEQEIAGAKLPFSDAAHALAALARRAPR